MTWNVAIAIRSLCVTLLAATLALVLIVTLAEDADARRVRRKKGVAEFSQTFVPPDRFSCTPRLGTVDTAVDWDPPTIQPPRPIDGYSCTAVGKVEVGQNSFGQPVQQARKFDLNDVLDLVVGCPSSVDPACGRPLSPAGRERAGLSGSCPGFDPPCGPLATPDLINCHWVPNVRELTDAAGNVVRISDRFESNFSCEFSENQQTCRFTMDRLVAINIDDVDAKGRVKIGAGGAPRQNLDKFLFLPIACHAVPHAVPAGADAAGEGSAAWLFGLVLAAGGAMVGGVVIARRRFLHDS